MMKMIGRSLIYGGVWFFLSCAILCAGMPSLSARECPALQPRSKPIIVGFAGWTLPLTSYRGSAVEQIIDRLRAGGASADVHPPDDWPEVAERLLSRETVDRPIVLLGFSMGASAAIHVAQKLGAVGVPVSNIVMVEAWNPEPIPANVAAATHFYSTRFAGLIRQGPGNDGVVENIDLNGRVPGIESASHVEMSRMAIVQDMIVAKIDPDKDGTRPADGTATDAGRRCAAKTLHSPRQVRPAPKR